MRLRLSTARAAGVAVVLALAGGVAPAAAHADSGKHYYIEVGGTGGSEPAPQCTHSYGFANQALAGNPDNVIVPVCYEAGAGPWQAANGDVPGIGAPSYTVSERQGYDHLLDTLESTYKADPVGRYTIVGYSQGAQAADEVLQAVAENRTDIPASQIDGMLYADPRQPDTGIWSRVPQGWGAFGFTSTGSGPLSFAGIPVARYCIHTDLACDATSPASVPGFIDEHPSYVREGGIISQTLADDGRNGIFWYPVGS